MNFGGLQSSWQVFSFWSLFLNGDRWNVAIISIYKGLEARVYPRKRLMNLDIMLEVTRGGVALAASIVTHVNGACSARLFRTAGSEMRGIKGAVEITAAGHRSSYYTNLKTLYISSTSAMPHDDSESQLPDPRLYFIFSRISVVGEHAGVVTLSFENKLRGLSGSLEPWSLKYVDRARGICTFSPMNAPASFLGVPNKSIEMDGTIYLKDLEEGEEAPQWTLKETDFGYTISQGSGDGERFWYLQNEGGKIKATPSNEGVQSWEFNEAS